MPTPDSLNHTAQFSQVAIHRGCSAPIPLCHTWDDKTVSMQTRADLWFWAGLRGPQERRGLRSQLDLRCQKEVFVSAVCLWGVDRQSGKKLDGEQAH